MARSGGEKKWIVFTRDKMIGRRKLRLDALFNAGVKAFVLVTDDLTDTQNADLIIKHIDKIFELIDENKIAFIAKYVRMLSFCGKQIRQF